jgi:putative acetyltransferase
MLLREFKSGDEPHLLEVFYSAIHDVACRDYTPEQLDAWAPRSITPGRWAAKMQEISPFVVEHDGRPIAYADVQPTGYMDHFFVAAPFNGRGVGSMLMLRILDTAAAGKIPVLTSNVSRTAQGFFRRFGFVIVEERAPVRDGVVIPNALMKKEL